MGASLRYYLLADDGHSQQAEVFEVGTISSS
jgi:hypothetical protein